MSAPGKAQSNGFARRSSSAVPTSSPQPPRAPPRVVGELSHLFEGTARRGRPRGLSTLSAPAIVTPRDDAGTLAPTLASTPTLTLILSLALALALALAFEALLIHPTPCIGLPVR